MKRKKLTITDEMEFTILKAKVDGLIEKLLFVCQTFDPKLDYDWIKYALNEVQDILDEKMSNDMFEN